MYGDDLQELENWQQTSNIDQLIQDSEDEVVDILDQIVRGLNLEPAEEDAIADLTAAVQVRTYICYIHTLCKCLIAFCGNNVSRNSSSKNNISRDKN